MPWLTRGGSVDLQRVSSFKSSFRALDISETVSSSLFIPSDVCLLPIYVKQFLSIVMFSILSCSHV